MPLLFEINDPDNVLCFVPSGHLVGDRFEDFPAQTHDTCWYHINQRLISLCYTQKPYSEVIHDPVILAIQQIKDQLVDIYSMQHMTKILLHELMNRKGSTKEQMKQALEKITFKDFTKMIRDEISEWNPDELKVADNIFSSPSKRAELINSVMLLSEKIRLIITNFASQARSSTEAANTNLTKQINAAIDEHYYMLLNTVLKAAFAPGKPVGDMLRSLRSDIDEVSAIPRAYNRHAVLIQLLEAANNAALGLKLITVPLEVDDAKQWKSIIMSILREHGPFKVSGFVGTQYYPKGTSVLHAELGSVQLLGFPKNSSRATEDADAHKVMVIGVTGNKIIYLDPTVPSVVGAPRQAFIMDIMKFIERIKEHHKTAFNNNCLQFDCLQPGMIDTTQELMDTQIQQSKSVRPRPQ